MTNYPTHEVWGGFVENGECDDPRHLEDCFSKPEADSAAIEWAGGQGRYAFVRAKDDYSKCGCGACLITPHASSCAVHNAPALPVGPCSCGDV